MAEQKKVIGINALFLIPNQVGGTEYHLRSFVKYLQKLDTTNEYVLFCNNENFDTFQLLSKRWRKVLCPINATNRIVRILYEQVVFPFVVKQSGCTLLHSYGYFGPLMTFGIPSIVTVHDVNWKDHPEDTSKLTTFLTGFLTESCMRSARQIVTDSEFSKKRILQYFPKYDTKLSVISPGVDDDFIQLLSQKTTSPLPNDYFLCVSACYPHKQIPKLLKWWSNARSRYPDTKLVLIGQNGADEALVSALSKSVPHVIRHAKVPYKELVRFYQHATAFVFPSTYEGFGYPVYEAVSAGVPVYVPEPSMYSPKIRQFVHAEPFDPADVRLLQKSTKALNPANSTLRYDPGVRSLIQFYSSTQ